MIYTIDTALTIRKLEDAGCDSKVALAIVDAISSTHDEIATKADSARLESSIEGLEKSTQAGFARLESSIEGLEKSTQAGFTRLENSIRTEFDLKLNALNASLTTKIIATQLATITLLIAAMKLFGL